MVPLNRGSSWTTLVTLSVKGLSRIILAGLPRMMFEELERFVTAHRGCGELTSDVGEIIESGYRLQLTYSCGAIFERCVTPEEADGDLLRSCLLAFPN
jgi:hypothetical protein